MVTTVTYNNAGRKVEVQTIIVRTFVAEISDTICILVQPNSNK